MTTALPKALVDSSFLIAIHNLRDVNNKRAVAFLKAYSTMQIIPDVILPEVTFLLNRSGGQRAVEFFLATFAATRPKLQVLLHEDLTRAREIMRAYPTARLDFVDCCIMALSERLNITQVCTFDRRDFALFRPAHCDYLELLP